MASRSLGLCERLGLAFLETLVTFLNCEIETSRLVFKKHLKRDGNFARPMIFEGPFSTHFWLLLLGNCCGGHGDCSVISLVVIFFAELSTTGIKW